MLLPVKRKVEVLNKEMMILKIPPAKSLVKTRTEPRKLRTPTPNSRRPNLSALREFSNSPLV
jgi:hypothetical protein